MARLGVPGTIGLLRLVALLELRLRAAGLPLRLMPKELDDHGVAGDEVELGLTTGLLGGVRMVKEDGLTLSGAVA